MIRTLITPKSTVEPRYVLALPIILAIVAHLTALSPQLGMILYTKYLVNDILVPNKDNIYVLAVHPGAVSPAMA